MITPKTEMEMMQLEYSLTLEKRIADLEAALRPFADAYRHVQTGPRGKFMRDQYYASMTVGKFTVQDLARAAELIPQPSDDRGTLPTRAGSPA